MSENKSYKIGTISAVLAALGALGVNSAAAAVSPVLNSRVVNVDLGKVLAGKEISKILLSDKLSISKILVGSKLETVATGYNQISEYTQGGGSDSFHQYSQSVSKTPLDKLQMTTNMLKKLKSLNYIR